MSLRLPAIQYGPWKIVRARMKKAIGALTRGAPLVEVIEADGLLDTATHPGLIVLHGNLIGPADSFHSFMPWKEAADALFKQRTQPTVPSPIEDQIFEASLTTTWGVLGLMAQDSGSWIWPQPRWQPFLHAALAAWSELDSVGARYYVALQGQPLWSVPNNLHYVLSNLGVPNSVLRAPLPTGGPSALLRYATSAS